ncbi:hypothetical protein NDN11_06625 [Acinetobacter sp. C26M]|uniref:Uncharacterized protein n=1 Tax=Acinetobacter genomosp. 15BJ TaxID=106651 RepID=R9AV72_9GAMM|nr:MULTISPECIES: hypothetical protein [Acinetobacter]EOR06088.1 hypothetical protein F896_02546 [Acinetobacter genomosp. 15BJ]MCH7290128.1 hypothetical protein [Acinetobacter genomosp. 15BJ]MDO3656541.1 hypothetical protein [Acinetobacter genomosp. 15BJ]NIE96270.1 hypothetical protein [Acinetobacter sp. Tr-809]USA47783.1 hypothetical protein NDN11_06625 [Acinetobacter sp. C26M]
MSAESLFINCECHGQNYAAVVCGHVLHNNNNNQPLGFIENISTPTNPQGWCLACEYVFTQENGMTDLFRNFNNMAIVCAECYSEIKNKHNIYPIQQST